MRRDPVELMLAPVMPLAMHRVATNTDRLEMAGIPSSFLLTIGRIRLDWIQKNWRKLKATKRLTALRMGVLTGSRTIRSRM